MVVQRFLILDLPIYVKGLCLSLLVLSALLLFLNDVEKGVIEKMTKLHVITDGKIDVEATKKLRKRASLSTEEIADMLSEADNFKKDWFRLRVKALIFITKKFGKPRS
jgi:hypothetical protein